MLIIGRKASTSENPMKLIRIAAELETKVVASIARPTFPVAPSRVSAITVKVASSYADICSGISEPRETEDFSRG
jgi:hypothetical protein